jgi:hypothetical protein
MQFVKPLKSAQVASLATFYKLGVGRIRALDEDEVGNVGK